MACKDTSGPSHPTVKHAFHAAIVFFFFETSCRYCGNAMSHDHSVLSLFPVLPLPILPYYNQLSSLFLLPLPASAPPDLSIPPPARVTATAFSGSFPLVAGGGWSAGVRLRRWRWTRTSRPGAGGPASSSRSTRSTSPTANCGSRSSLATTLRGQAGTAAAGALLIGRATASAAARSCARRKVSRDILAPHVAIS